jgi:hypothetical protein
MKFKYKVFTIICLIALIPIIIGLIGSILYSNMETLPVFYSLCFLIGIPLEFLGVTTLLINLSEDF